MNLNKKIVITVSLILLLVAGFYTAEKVIKTEGLNSATIIKVSNNGKVAAYISADVLEKLMEKDSQEDNMSKGPSLISAVNAAGFDRYSEIEVMGIGNGNSIDLNSKGIDNNLILYIGEDGKINLCGNKGSSLLVKGVTEINIKL